MADGQGVIVASGGSARGRGPEIAALAREGLSSTAIGERLGVAGKNVAAMLTHLRRLDPSLPPASRTRHPPRRLDEARLARIVALALDGNTPREIAAMMALRAGFVTDQLSIARKRDPSIPRFCGARRTKTEVVTLTDTLLKLKAEGLSTDAAAREAGTTFDSAKALLRRAAAIAGEAEAAAPRETRPRPPKAKAKTASAGPAWTVAEEMAARGYAARGLRLTAIAALMRRPYAQIAGAIERGRAEREKGRAGA